MNETSSPKTFSYAVVLVAFIVSTWFFQQFAGIMKPIILGVIIGFIFSPFLLFLIRKKVPRFLSFIIVIILFFVISVVFVYLIANSLVNLGSNFSQYRSNFLAIIDSVAPLIPFIHYDGLVSVQESIFTYIQSNLLRISSSFLQSFVSFSKQYIIVFFTTTFVLVERALFFAKIKAIYKENVVSSERFSVLILNINIQVSRFLLLKTLISLLTAVIIYIGFGFIGVDFIFTWAILTFMFNFIPTVGSLIITLISIIFAFIQFFPEYPPVLLVAILTVGTQMLVGNFLDPKIMGDNLNLSPLVIWLFLIYWGSIWGAVGALLAVPFAVIIRIIFEHIPSLSGAGVLMGSGRFLNYKQDINKQHKQNSKLNQMLYDWIHKNHDI